MVQKELQQAWWFDGHNLAKPSPWLGHTLSELDDKTKQMLKLIDQDADSFAQRAEMYYKKRPVLVDMLGDLYRAHRSLAEQYDTLKHSCSTRRSMLTPSPSTKSWSPSSMDGKATGSSSSNSLCSDSYDSESEVDDPEEHPEEEHDEKVSEGQIEAEKDQPDPEAELMRAEIKRLTEQNSELQKAIEDNKAAQQAELAAKDEEKREVIRQLASSIHIVKQENYTLRECIKSSKQHQPAPSSRGFDLKKLTKDLFSAKLFTAHCRPSGPLVAL
ncbi:protein NETWORKED 3C-like [Lolium rigidum]|uniref:protein NETWORKED 3C-like n=1 Tax=Lolium rigidum TaxID=89674 RepID=UPI001F5D9C6F|nr:protein NETWORKED 3C-like [Lolium rigidum]